MTEKEELDIYRRLLVNLHTARWTGNHVKVGMILDKIGEYSYARTNSNGHQEEEEIKMEETLKALDT